MKERKSLFGGSCDKCKKPVPPENDAGLLDAVREGGNNPFYSSRHLRETPDCQGSPSRAQYLPGESRDNRGYGYNPELEEEIRAADRVIQSALSKDNGDNLLLSVMDLISAVRRPKNKK